MAHRTMAADVVINAVSAPSHRIPAPAAPLVRSMVTGRTAARHPHGGLSIEPSTSRLTVDAVPDPRLYAVGDITAGSLFFTFGIPVLAERSRDIVNAIGADAATAVVPG